MNTDTLGVSMDTFKQGEERVSTLLVTVRGSNEFGETE
jgi:hypothetical protein